MYTFFSVATSADFMFTSFRFQFTSVLQPNSTAANQLVIPIVDDDIAEPRESFICTLQSGSTQSVQTRHPEQVTVDIIDDDGEMYSVQCAVVHMSTHQTCLLIDCQS